MKQEINYSKFVDRYLDGVMSAEERNWFEKELEGDDHLQSELNLHEKLDEALVNMEIIELEKQLDTIHDELYQPWVKAFDLSARTKKTVSALVTIAAALVLIAVGSIRIFTGGASTDELYASYYQPAEMNMSFRTAEDLVDSDLRSAMILYENEDYKEAIALFEKILIADNSRIGLNLYTGISHMEIEEYELANQNFKKIIDHKANAFIESAQWYLGLCYLRTEEDDRAVEIFNEIAEGEGFYEKEAKKILKKLE